MKIKITKYNNYFKKIHYILQYLQYTFHQKSKRKIFQYNAKQNFHLKYFVKNFYSLL